MSSFYMKRKRQRTRQPSEIVSSDRSSSFCDIHSHTMREWETHDHRQEATKETTDMKTKRVENEGSHRET